MCLIIRHINNNYFEGGRVNMAPRKMEEKMIGQGRDFDRIRRITGYLVGTIDRWNNAKRAEEKDRVKHNMP